MIDIDIDDIQIFSRNGKYGALGIYRRQIIPCEYDKLTKGRDYIEAEKDGKWGAFNVKGDVVIPLEYESIRSYDKFIELKKDGKYGALDLQGNVIVPLEYDSISIRFDCVTVKKDGKKGHFNLQDNVIVSGESEFDCSNVVTKVVESCKNRWIDKSKAVIAEAPCYKETYNSIEEVKEIFDANAKAQKIVVDYKIAHAKTSEEIGQIVADFATVMDWIIEKKTEELNKLNKFNKELNTAKQRAQGLIGDVMAKYNATSEVDGGLDV